MIEQVPDLKPIPVPFSGGIDEESASDAIAPEDAVKMTNWRLSKNGKRIQKRAGLQEEDTAFGEDVYGYATYVDADAAFCQVAVLESQIKRKVGAGVWTGIHTFVDSEEAPWSIDHTVKILEIQNKQFIITEKGSCVILGDGTVRQIGIDPPESLATAAAEYTLGSSALLLDEHFAGYNTTGELDAVWGDLDERNGISELATSDPVGVIKEGSHPGPDNDQRYLKLYESSGVGPGGRGLDLEKTIPSIYAVEFAVFHQLYSFGGFQIKVWNGVSLLHLKIHYDGLYIVDSRDNTQYVNGPFPIETWITWKAIVDTTNQYSTKVRLFNVIAGVVKEFGEYTFNSSDTTHAARVEVYQYGNAYVGPGKAYVDYVIISQTIDYESEGTNLLFGSYRYAVTFFRGEDYGCESNPIKSIVGDVSFDGSGTNDMTIDESSSYTGLGGKSFVVEVLTAGTPDIIRWSENGGGTWSSEVAVASLVYLPYGIVLKFDTTTGHTEGDQWSFVASGCSAVPTNQYIRLTNIPTSADEQVTGRKLYRTTSGGSRFYYLTTIYDRASTTEFVDSIPDSALGEEMEEDRDRFTEASDTIGKCFELWDNRLWVADSPENLIYYSAVRSGGGVPEEFSLDERFIPILRGDQGDKITAMIAFKDALYVFKRNDIFIIQKTAFGYAPYHLNSDVGCIGDNCVISVNDMLMFPSERGLEIYDGVKPFGPEFAVAINKTFLTADPAGYKYMSIAHDKQYNEVWFSIPSRLSGAAAITTVWNYVRNRFYYFQFYKAPSCLVSCKDSTGKRVLKMGTRDGFIDLCDYGTADHTTAITATYRKGWLDMHAHGIGRLLTTKYELPATKTITANLYVDMQSAVFRTAALTGVTPGATDIDLRRVIGDKSELGSRHRWISVEYVSADDAGGDVKINEAFLFVVPKVIKKKTYAN